MVYGLAEERLYELTGEDPQNPTLKLPCREVFARSRRPVEVIGPLLWKESEAVHEGFWKV